MKAQITSILVAGSFALIGLLGQDNIEINLINVGNVICILMGMLNFLIVLMHNNRFERHVDITRQARYQISELNFEAKIPNFGSLASAWLLVTCIPSLLGYILLILELNKCN